MKLGKLLLLLLSSFTFAQINTDRPSLSTGTHITPLRTFLLENGINYSHSEKNFSLNVVARTGISSLPKSEISIGTDLSLSGKENSYVLGTKIQIAASEDENKPQFAVYADTNFKNYSFSGLLDQKLNKNMELTLNMGYEKAEALDMFTFISTVNKDLSPSLSVYGEYFSEFSQNTSPSHGLDAGIAYIIQPHAQIDFAAGSYLNHFKDNYFLTFGFSYEL